MDLGTALAEYDARKGKKRRGKRVNEMSGVQLRPKRRAPISEVLLVGGATRMPAVQRFVRNMTGLQPREFVVDPDEVPKPRTPKNQYVQPRQFVLSRVTVKNNHVLQRRAGKTLTFDPNLLVSPSEP